MEEKQQRKKSKKKEKRLSLLYVLGGGILNEDFIVKHTRMIVLVVIMIFFFIGNRYTCMQKLREIRPPATTFARHSFRGIVYFIGTDGQQPSVASRIID